MSAAAQTLQNDLIGAPEDIFQDCIKKLKEQASVLAPSVQKNFLEVVEVMATGNITCDSRFTTPRDIEHAREFGPSLNFVDMGLTDHHLKLIFLALKNTKLKYNQLFLTRNQAFDFTTLANCFSELHSAGKSKVCNIYFLPEIVRRAWPEGFVDQVSAIDVGIILIEAKQPTFTPAANAAGAAAAGAVAAFAAPAASIAPMVAAPAAPAAAAPGAMTANPK